MIIIGRLMRIPFCFHTVISQYFLLQRSLHRGKALKSNGISKSDHRGFADICLPADLSQREIAGLLQMTQNILCHLFLAGRQLRYFFFHQCFKLHILFVRTPSEPDPHTLLPGRLTEHLCSQFIFPLSPALVNPKFP